MKLVGRNVVNKVLVSITVQVDRSEEMAAYRKIPGIQTCPTCGKPVNPKPENMKLLIMNPLNEFIPGVSIDVGQAITKCSECGAEVADDAQCDLSAYPDVEGFLGKLRATARAQIVKGGAKRG